MAKIKGAYNPFIQRYFLGVFRFARMALADVRTLTYGSRNKILHRKHSTPIIEMAGTSQMLPGPAAGEVAPGLSSPRGSAPNEQTPAEGPAHICDWPAPPPPHRTHSLRPPP